MILFIGILKMKIICTHLLNGAPLNDLVFLELSPKKCENWNLWGYSRGASAVDEGGRGHVAEDDAEHDEEGEGTRRIHLSWSLYVREKKKLKHFFY